MYLNVPCDPSPEEDLLAQASQVAALASSRRLTASERASIRSWLGEKPERAAALRVAMDTWDEAPSTLAPLGYQRETSRGHKPALWASAFAGAAAALAALIWLVPTKAPEPLLLATAGQMQTFALRDGSSVKLEPDGKLSVLFDEDSREVVMSDGQARFLVTKGKRPFSVDTGEIKVVVTGTQFTITKTDAQTQVELFEGGVSLYANGIEVAAMKPGDLAIFAIPNKQLQVFRAGARPAAVTQSARLAPPSSVSGSRAEIHESDTVSLGRYAAMVEQSTGQRIRLETSDLASINFEMAQNEVPSLSGLEIKTGQLGLMLNAAADEIVIKRSRPTD